MMIINVTPKSSVSCEVQTRPSQPLGGRSCKVRDRVNENLIFDGLKDCSNLNSVLRLSFKITPSYITSPHRVCDI